MSRSLACLPACSLARLLACLLAAVGMAIDSLEHADTSVFVGASGAVEWRPDQLQVPDHPVHFLKEVPQLIQARDVHAMRVHCETLSIATPTAASEQASKGESDQASKQAGKQASKRTLSSCFICSCFRGRAGTESVHESMVHPNAIVILVFLVVVGGIVIVMLVCVVVVRAAAVVLRVRAQHV